MAMSSKTKLISLAVVAVMVPTTILSVIQYQSLQDLQSATKLAAQESLRQALNSISGRAEEELMWIAEKALGTIDVKEVNRENISLIENHFENAVRANPQIEALWLSYEPDCEDAEFVVITRAQGSLRMTYPRLARNEFVRTTRQLFETTKANAYPEGRISREFFFAHLSECEGASCRKGHDFQTIVFYPLVSSGQSFGFAAVSIESSFVTEVLFDKTLPGALDEELAFAIFDENRTELYSTPDALKNYEVALSFEPVFPKWRLEAGFRNTTIDAIASENFEKSLTLSLFVLSLLIFGIVLTLRATAREMRLAEAKSTFVSNVSHELKTPLALIRLFAETLELGRVRSSEKAGEYYRIISNESRRLTQLINNILDFSRIEAGRKEYQFETTNVADVVREVIETYQYPLENAGFEIATDIEADLPAVRIDRDAMSQAVLNLVNNAVKYSDEVKHIDVRVRSRGSSVAVEVADKGIGIPGAEQEKIFEKFYRISTGLVHDRKGSGLGLALVRHIVKAHSGEIVVDSTPGKGSRFTVLIPMSLESGLG